MPKINQEIAEETGIHIGDGSMNIYNGVYCYTLACHHIDDKDYMDNYVAPLYQRIYGITPKLRLWSQGAYGFRTHDKKIAEFKHKVLNLPFGKKNSIEIPKQILSNVKFQRAFLRGFVSTDGSVNTFIANKLTVYPRIEMCNISEKLMCQINNILMNLGFRTSIWKINKNKPRWNEGLRLTVNGYEMLNKWVKEIGFVNPKQIRRLDDLNLKEQCF